MIRVFIAAASAIARAGLESLLGSSDHIEIGGIEEADVIVADQEVPQELVGAKAAVVLLASEPTLEAIRSGARAVLSRDASTEQMIAAIQAVAAGLVVVQLDDLGSPRTVELTESLTARETEVLGMMAEGLANKAIAHRLGISEHTVKFHVTSIMGKLSAASRTEAVTRGIRQGLILV